MTITQNNIEKLANAVIENYQTLEELKVLEDTRKNKNKTFKIKYKNIVLEEKDTRLYFDINKIYVDSMRRMQNIVKDAFYNFYSESKEANEIIKDMLVVGTSKEKMIESLTKFYELTNVDEESYNTLLEEVTKAVKINYRNTMSYIELQIKKEEKRLTTEIVELAEEVLYKERMEKDEDFFTNNPFENAIKTKCITDFDANNQYQVDEFMEKLENSLRKEAESLLEDAYKFVG